MIGHSGAAGGCVSPKLVLWLMVLAGCTAQARDREPSASANARELPAARASAATDVTAPSAAEASGTQQAQHADATPAENLSNGALELAGDLRPQEAADLAFKVGGQLAAVKVKRGERVKKGQLLALISDVEARGQLAQAQAAVEQAEAQLALVKDSETRATSLAAANAAPGSQAVTLRLQADVAKAAVLTARAARDLAAVVLANYQLKAPFDGEVVRVPDGVGQFVAPGVPLLRVEELDRLTLRATVAEADLPRIHVGDRVSIETASAAVIGRVRVVLRSLEPVSRRAPVEVEVPNPDRVLVAGSYVRATVTPR